MLLKVTRYGGVCLSEPASDAVEIDGPMVVFQILDEELNQLFNKKAIPAEILDVIPNVRSNEIKITGGEGKLQLVKPVSWALKGAKLHLRGDDDSERLDGELNFDLLQWKTNASERLYWLPESLSWTQPISCTQRKSA